MSEDKAVTLLARDPAGRFLPGHNLGGRPPKMTDATVAELVEMVAGGMTLFDACNSSERYPSPWRAYRWASDDGKDDEDGGELRDRFRHMLAVARERHADRLAEMYEQRARECRDDKDAAAAVRELGAMVRWRTAVLAPRRYARRAQEAAGSAVDVSVAVQVIVPPKDGSEGGS